MKKDYYKILTVLTCFLLITITILFSTTVQNVYANEIPLSTQSLIDAPPKEWEKRFGGSDTDIGYFVEQTRDEGYILIGTTKSFGAGSTDVLLIKTDASGEEIWNKTFGGTSADHGKSVYQTKDNGFILFGTTYSFDQGNGDAWLIKTDASGNELLNKTFGGSNPEEGYYLQQTNDDGYILTGFGFFDDGIELDVFLIKTDASGEASWQKHFNRSHDDIGLCVQQTGDGGYVLSGITDYYGMETGDIWVVKTNEEGEMQWNKTYGGQKSDAGFCIQQTLDGGYVIVGSTSSFKAEKNDIYFFKINKTGAMVWQKQFGGLEDDIGYDVQLTDDGGFIIVGRKEDHLANGDIWLIKTDALGEPQWDHVFVRDGFEESWSVKQTKDKGYILVGYGDAPGETIQDIYLIKMATHLQASISSITGGVGITINISNTCGSTLTDIVVKISGEGGFFLFLPKDTIEISSLEPGESQDINLKVFGIGFGFIRDAPELTITVEANDAIPVEKTCSFWLFGMFTRIVE